MAKRSRRLASEAVRRNGGRRKDPEPRPPWISVRSSFKAYVRVRGRITGWIHILRCRELAKRIASHGDPEIPRENGFWPPRSSHLQSHSVHVAVGVFRCP